MPYKNEKQFWHVRVSRNRKKDCEALAKKLGFTSIVQLLNAAIDNFTEKHR